MLDQFDGVIVTDEHKSYQKLADADNGIVARGGCWSHCRRKYADAVKGRRHSSDAHTMLKHIVRLYKLEEKTKSLTGPEKIERRQKLLTLQLTIIHQSTEAMSGKYINDGLMHKAVGYTLNSWSSLTRRECAVERSHSSVGESPTRQGSFQPVAVGTISRRLIEKHSDVKGSFRDSASNQAVM